MHASTAIANEKKRGEVAATSMQPHRETETASKTAAAAQHSLRTLIATIPTTTNSTTNIAWIANESASHLRI